MKKLLGTLLCALALLALAAPSARAGADKAPPSSRAATTGAGGVVNLNSADESTLELLPYVGPARAKQILEFRAKHPFKKVDDLVRIKGIGKKTMVKMRPYLAISGPSTLTEKAGKVTKAAKAEKEAAPAERN